jgi:2-amino-4-hydroxy-6-hydroxymethyldihydropteridine diphosphokinase
VTDAIVLGLGGNVGGDDAVLARFARVAEALAAWGRVRASRVYRTAPVGGPAQPDFLNAALAIHADPEPTPRELIETVQELERLCGRDRARGVRWGPRPIDLDVLLWGAREIDHEGPPRLRVPHERLAERRFAIAPVVDLLGEHAIVPGDGRTLCAILEATAGQRVELTDFRITLPSQR